MLYAYIQELKSDNQGKIKKNYTKTNDFENHARNKILVLFHRHLQLGGLISF